MRPKIVITYNEFLDPIFKGWILSQKKFKDWVAPSLDDVKKNVKEYEKEWEKYGDRILDGLTTITNLSFKRNQIDIHVVSGNPRPFSRPIVLKSRYSPIDFINIVTHELIHCLFVDNEKELDGKEFYKIENKIVSSHVLIYAILKSVYFDILNEPERFERNMQSLSEYDSDSNAAYKEAWNIVNKIGYKEIIKGFR
ncbi:MAG: hypothetical protein P4L61_01715 [Candidatus Pacebacteria bacterium]|nr:hypothetical protein [Candidatus Paceibacterota bacterium]